MSDETVVPPSTAPTAPAEDPTRYDLTATVARSLDRHLIFPLLEFLSQQELYPAEELDAAKLELIEKTNMVDYAADIYQALNQTEEARLGRAQSRGRGALRVQAPGLWAWAGRASLRPARQAASRPGSDRLVRAELGCDAGEWPTRAARAPKRAAGWGSEAFRGAPRVMGLAARPPRAVRGRGAHQPLRVALLRRDLLVSIAVPPRDPACTRRGGEPDLGATGGETGREAAARRGERARGRGAHRAEASGGRERGGGRGSERASEGREGGAGIALDSSRRRQQEASGKASWRRDGAGRDVVAVERVGRALPA